MTKISRRELLAWMTAGSATAAAGWAFADGSDASAPRRPAGTQPDADRSADAESNTVERAPTRSDSGEVAAAAPRAPSPLAATADRVLVIVEFGGGNDGLSTVVPYGMRGYYDARSTFSIPAGDVLAIDDEIGFHPELANVAARGAAVVQGVGSSAPDGSHFEMMRRWWRGYPTESTYGPGWVGRLADLIGSQDAIATAISVGSGMHPILQSRVAPTLAVPGPDAAWYLAGADDAGVQQAFQRGVRAIGGQTGDGYYGQLTSMAARTVDLADRLTEVEEDAVGKHRYPETDLGQSLAFARQLFSLDAGVRIVHVVMNEDFDTHEGHGWRHPELMKSFNAAVGAFWSDVDAAGLDDRMLLMTTSEFGRTLRENGSAGLDHGTAASALVMGRVEAARIGDHPSLTSLDGNDDLIATAGFDSYLGSVVEGWFGVPASEVFDTKPDLFPLTFA